MKKLVFVVLTTSLLLMMVLFSAYAEDGIQPCYTLTSDVSAALSISGGTATCSGKILMRSGSSASMTMKCQIKEKVPAKSVGTQHHLKDDGFHKDSLIVASTRIFFKHLIGKL